VFPPVTGGLHCGKTLIVHRPPLGAVLPPFGGGLHCGRLTVIGMLAADLVPSLRL
jgi:hypothetical protein